MKIKERLIADLNPAEYNPRQLTDKQYKQLKKSLKTFGCVEPVVINSNPMRRDVIIGGHQRCKVWADLGNKTIPTVEVELDEAGEMELNVRLNKNTGEFDFDMLANYFEMDTLKDWGFEDYEFGVPYDEEEEHIDEEAYTKKIEAPVYEPTGEKPEINEMYNIDKYESFIKNIETSGVPDNIKDFLKVAASRHIVFNYSNIAEYYAHAEKEIQDLMEESALVIIDFNKAIQNGYVKLTEKLKEQYNEL